MKLKLYITILALSVLACKKKSEVSPEPNPVITKPVSIPECTSLLFSLPLFAYNPGDTIRAKNGILHLHIQSKTDARNNMIFFGSYANVIKGDFLLTMEINRLSLSTTNSPKPGSFMFSLNNVTGSTVKKIYSTISPSVFSWQTAYSDTLTSNKATFPLPTIFKYKISRIGSLIEARLYYNTDSLVAQKTDFGTQDLTIDFSLDSDTSGKEYSSVQVVDLQLKQGTGNTVKENFGCTTNYYPR
jgi:hypothetical protein